MHDRQDLDAGSDNHGILSRLEDLAMSLAMLTIRYPKILSHLKKFRFGLMPVFLGTIGILVLKVPKEAILTARIRNEVKMYLLSESSTSSEHLGVITAFFDDYDEPLTITTLLFSDDDLLPDLSTVLTQPQFDVYFFDEQNQEWIGVQANNSDAERCRREFRAATFAPFDMAAYVGQANRLNQRFAVRNDHDDRAAFILTLGERLYPDNLTIIKARPQSYKSIRTEPRTAALTLIREDPGPQRESDIALLLSEAFPAENIYLNPFRADTGKELTDVMVITRQIMLLVEAKDSPNTPASLNRSLKRKRQSVQKHIEKAAKQLRGGLSYASEQRGVEIQTLDGSIEMRLGNRQLLGLIVVSEMFDDSQVDNSKPVLDLTRDICLPVMLIDYAGLHAITSNLRTPQQFLNALHYIFDTALEEGQFPRSVWNGPPFGYDSTE